MRRTIFVTHVELERLTRLLERHQRSVRDAESCAALVAVTCQPEAAGDTAL